MQLTNNVHAFFEDLSRSFENVQRIILRSFTPDGTRLLFFMMDVSDADAAVTPIYGTVSLAKQMETHRQWCDFLQCDSPTEFIPEINRFNESGAELGVLKKRDRVIVFQKMRSKVNVYNGEANELPSAPQTWLPVLSHFPKPVIGTVVHRGGSSEIKVTIDIKKSTPKLIGQGSYGCVYYPPLPCKNQAACTSKYCKTGVSKLIESGEAEKEMKENVEIRKIDPDGKYHWAVEGKCDLPDGFAIPDVEKCDPYTSYNHYVSIIMPYGGKALSEVVREGGHISTFLINSLENLFEALVLFKKKNFVHSDIKSANAVFTGDPKGSTKDPIRLKFIDFGLSFSYKDGSDPFDKSPMFDLNNMRGGYPYWPPEISLWDYVYTTYALSLEFENTKLFRKSLSHYGIWGTTFANPFYPEKPYPYWTSEDERLPEWEDIFNFYNTGKDGNPSTLKCIGDIFAKLLSRPDLSSEARSRVITEIKRVFKIIAQKIDTFSLGVILARIYRKIVKGENVETELLHNEAFKTKLKELVKGMIDPNFTTRYYPEEALEKFKEVKRSIAPIHSSHVWRQTGEGRSKLSRRRSMGP